MLGGQIVDKVCVVVLMLGFIMSGCSSDGSSNTPNQKDDSEVKKPVLKTGADASAGFKVKSVSGSINRLCAIDMHDELWCWGENVILGSGGLDPKPSLGITSTQASVLKPNKVVGSGKWESVVVAGHSTCGIQVGGQLYCWGRNLPAMTFTTPYPYLGLGIKDAILSTPQPVSGGQLFKRVFYDNREPYFLALSLTDKLYEIGHQSAGPNEPRPITNGGKTADQIVLAASSGRAGSRDIATFDTAKNLWHNQSLIKSGITITSLVAVAKGSYCALNDGGEVYCFGNNKIEVFPNVYFDFLGVAAGNSSTVTFSKVAMPAKVNITQLDGDEGSICAIDTNRDLWCWGRNYGIDEVSTGILGTKSLDPIVKAPSKVMANVRSVNVGSSRICAINIANELFCFGDNRLKEQSFAMGTGILGVGSSSPVVSSPTQVLGGLSFASVAIFADAMNRSASMCGISTDTILYCWGDNGQFQTKGYLGVGSSSMIVDRPTKVVFP